MRHAVKGKQLNRDITSRRALFKNLSLSLIEHGSITTTKAKANALRGSFEKLITKAKKNTVHARRLIDQELNQTKAVNRLVDEIAPKLNRSSGFLKISKIGKRRGDDAEMVKLEILDWKPAVEAKSSKDKEAAKAPTKKEEAKKPASSTAKKTAPVKDEKVVNKAPRQPQSATTAAKHVPQKRISGGK